MTRIVETADVQAPVDDVYNVWTRVEDFPAFLDEVDSVRQESDTRTAWTVTIAGQTREFITEITEQQPDERIAWTSTSGDVDHAGIVTFHRLSDDSTRVAVQIDWNPESALEKAGSGLGIPRRAVHRELGRFTDYVERTGANGPGWRGEVGP